MNQQTATTRTQPVTPWNPSRRATARVTAPLPAPTTCQHCGSAVELVDNATIYGRSYGDWPWAFLCRGEGCGAYVGLHPFTGIPLGTLATKPTREARLSAKSAFNNATWRTGRMTRSEAYAWLAQVMGIANVDECHIGWFDAEQCQRVIEASNAKRAAAKWSAA